MKKSLLLLSALALTTGVSFGALKGTTRNAGKLTEAPAGFIQGPLAVPGEASQAANVRANAEGDDVSISFGYGDEVATATTFGDTALAGYYIYYAFEIPAEDAAMFAGATITGVNVTSSTNATNLNPVTKVEVFVTEDLNVFPTLHEGKLSSKGLTSTLVPLSTPFTISGDKSVYVGYRQQLPTSATILTKYYYLPVDYVPTDAQTNLVALQATDTEMPQYHNYADQVGSNPMSAQISNLRSDVAIQTYIDVERYFKFGETVSYDLTVRNLGRTPLTTVDTKTVVSNGAFYEQMVTLAKPIAPGATGTVTVTEVPNPMEGIFTLTGSATKFNGADAFKPEEMTAAYYTYASGYERIPVIEEGTSVGCGFCPRGIVMMEYLKEKYPDWIRIAVHKNYNGYTDKMQLSGYLGFINAYISGFPGAVTNRYYYTNPNGTNDTFYKAIYNYFKSYPAYCELDMEVTPNEDNSRITVDAYAMFSIDTEIDHQLSFVVIEDGVGPYNQVNYYAGGSYGAMGGWESKRDPASTVYDDVPRVIKSYPGIKNSLPVNIEKNTKYDYSTTIPIKTVTSDKYRVVGMIVNSLTGEIVNAREVNVDVSGVNEVADDAQAIDIRVVNGDIVVNGANNVAVYTLDGRRVATTGLSTGVYIVNADGVSSKVLVK